MVIRATRGGSDSHSNWSLALSITLKNKHLTARFDPDDGRLIHLSASGRGQGLVADAPVRYFLTKDQSAVAAYNLQPDDKAGPIICTSVKSSDDTVTATYEGEHVHLTVTYTLPENSPLLHVKSTIRGTGADGEARYIWAPRFQFTDGFNDQFEDTEDLYDDGAEVGPDKELPCWRVFFRKGHRDGLILATRDKENMSHFNITADGFEVQPQAALNYSTATLAHEKPLNAASRTKYTADFEIAPWTRAGHKALLRKAKLTEPVKVKHPAAKGKPRANLRGKIIHATKFAPKNAVNKTFSRNKWQIVSVPWSQSGKALFASTGVKPPQFSFEPKLKGLYHVYAGVGSGEGLTLRASGDPETHIRISREVRNQGHGNASTWVCRLSGQHKPSEVDFGVMRLDGRNLRVGRFPDTQRPCMLDYLRFEPLDDRAAAKWEAAEKRHPKLPIAGLFDCPDVSTLLDAKDPDPGVFAANVWEHANSGVRRIYYRIDGQCSDFPSKTNTMRYISARVHGVFSPHSKAYGRVLQKADILRIAADAGKKYDVDIYGWMRFNNYTGNVQSDFYKSNPQYWEEWEHGRKGGKLCIAHKAVRKHKIDILVEAAKDYGLPGLCLGFLRHPPVLLYAKVMRDAYKRKYGKEPPREPDRPDNLHRFEVPEREDPEYERWWAFRAQYLTTFGRELRAALKKAGCEHVRIVIWLRPQHCLFDGIDLDAWLNEGLCDEVITQQYVQASHAPELGWADKAWRKKVQAKVPLAHALLPNIKMAKADLKRILADGYNGIGTYESNDTVLDSDFIKLFRSLRR